MKLVQINCFSGKSTGQIMFNIHRLAEQEGIDSYVVWGRGRNSVDEHEICIKNKIGMYVDGVATRLTDACGFFSVRATKKLIKELECLQPDIVHLHNLHGYYINIKMLFEYLKKNDIKVVWTLHDFWSVTGHCAFFECAKCDKWKVQCRNCIQKKEYPASIFLDRSFKNYIWKKETFCGIQMQFVTVSKWQESIVKQSFLKGQKIRTIYNGVNTEVFRYTESNLRKRYKLEGKKVILGVASDWSQRKGLDDFILLSKQLSMDYQIVLIGLNNRQIRNCPDNILAFPKTDCVEDLVKWYSCADVYVNATLEETFGMTTIEALACGTPVIVYNSTAMPELIHGSHGYVVEKRDINQIEKILKDNEIYSINREECMRAAGEYTSYQQCKNYLELYRALEEENKICN